jgi:hypothetical protein
MATAGQNKNYSAADFHRYHSGTMNEAEMYALEKAALEDPFLSDALEGYAITKTGEEDIVALKKKIVEKEDNKRSILLFLKESVWLKVAAILIIMLSVFYFANNNHSNIQPQLAKKGESNVTVPAIIKTDSTATYTWSAPVIGSGSLQRDTNRFLDAQSTALTATKPNKTEYSVTNTAAGNGAYTYAVTPPASYGVTADSSVAFKEVTNNSDIEIPIEKKMVTANGQVRQSKWASDSNNNYYYGKVVDVKGNPISFATITFPQKKTGFITDTAGRFSIISLDTVSPATIAAVGYSTTQTKLTSNPNQTIVLSPASTELSSVVITSKESKRKDAYVDKGLLDGKVSGLALTENTPVHGWGNYQAYLADSMRLPATVNKPIAKGTVILSFIIKKDGTAKKIKVEKSLSEDCDKEAIRLLREGPKWNYKNEKRTTLSINF